MTQAELEETYPGVNRAYDFVLPSYQMLSARFEAADGRITAALTLAATLTLGAPIFARAVRTNIAFDSPWFIGAVVAFVVAYVWGLVGRTRGRLTLPDPAAIYGESLHENEWAFKKNAVYFAGRHFDLNSEAVRVKGNVSIVMTACLLVEVVLLIAWITR